MTELRYRFQNWVLLVKYKERDFFLNCMRTLSDSKETQNKWPTVVSTSIPKNTPGSRLLQVPVTEWCWHPGSSQALSLQPLP